MASSSVDLNAIAEALRRGDRSAVREELSEPEVVVAACHALSDRVSSPDASAKPSLASLAMLCAVLSESPAAASAMVGRGAVASLVAVLGNVEGADISVRADAALALVHMSLCADASTREETARAGIVGVLGAAVRGRGGPMVAQMKKQMIKNKNTRFSRYCSMCGRKWCFRCALSRLEKQVALAPDPKRPTPKWVNGKISEDEVYECVNRLYGDAMGRIENAKEKQRPSTASGVPSIYGERFAPARLKFKEYNPHSEHSRKVDGNFIGAFVPVRPRSAPQRRETFERLYEKSLDDKIKKTQLLYNKYEKRLDASKLVVYGKAGRFSAVLEDL